MIFRLIKKNKKVLSKHKGFFNRYKFNHEKTKVFPKDENLTKKR
jgi:hypothetical protein